MRVSARVRVRGGMETRKRNKNPRGKDGGGGGGGGGGGQYVQHRSTGYQENRNRLRLRHYMLPTPHTKSRVLWKNMFRHYMTRGGRGRRGDRDF